jgi:TolB protein
MRFTDVALIAAESAVLALTACRDSSGPKSSSLALTGRLERGSIVRVDATQAGKPVDAKSVQLAFTPTDGASVLGDGTVKFLKAGHLAISATLPDQSIAKLEVDVALPPTVVFDMSANGNRDIYKVVLDGADLSRLTTDPGDDSEPTAASTGPVVFVSRRDGNAELYSIPLAGGAETRLTNTPVNEVSPQLSGDGLVLAFTRDDIGVGRVYTATATASSPHALTSSFGTSGTVEVGPALSLHGDSVVFTATAEGNPNLYSTHSSSTSAPTRMLALSFDSVRVEAAWSRDGKKVAFVAAGANASQLFTYDFQTGAVAKLTNDTQSLGQPAWLPDGRLLFTRFGSGQTSLCWLDPASPSTITVIPVSGTDPQHPSGASE